MVFESKMTLMSWMHKKKETWQKSMNFPNLLWVCNVGPISMSNTHHDKSIVVEDHMVLGVHPQLETL
jgi:hypothetical protein